MRGRARDDTHLSLAEDALSHLGSVVRVPESAMDAITAVSGSGPAYFALLAEAMIEAGILLGLSREISTQLVVQTMLGTAKQLRDEKLHPVELREMVTSPGGTTIAAIRELEQAGVRAAFLNAIQAAMDRSRELAQRVTAEIRISDDPAGEAAGLLAGLARDGGHVALAGGSTANLVYARGGGAGAGLEPHGGLVGRRSRGPSRRRVLELPPRPRAPARPARNPPARRAPDPAASSARRRRRGATTASSRA